MFESLNTFFEGAAGVWTLRILGASLASNMGHFLMEYTINPKWYKWNHAFMVCFILSMLFAWLDSEGEPWKYVVKSGLVCAGGSMITFYIGHFFGESIIKKFIKHKRK
jgi:ABC-type uncharacterized transport system permease subunit